MKFKYHLAILLAAIYYGLVSVGGKYFADLGFSLYEIASLILFAAAVLLPVLLISPRVRIAQHELPFYVLFGLLGAALQLTQYAGIVLGLPVAVVALLLYTQPVWTTLLGKVLLNERITGTKVMAAVIALLGTLVLIDPFGKAVRFNLVGVVCALAAGFLLSLWVIWGRKSGLRGQHFVTSTFGYFFFTSCFMLVFYPFVAVFLDDPQFVRFDFSVYAAHWQAVVLFAVVANVLPALLALVGMQKVDASTAGILLLFEPVSAALLARVFFRQALTENVWLGGGLILLANLVLVRRRDEG